MFRKALRIRAFPEWPAARDFAPKLLESIAPRLARRTDAGARPQARRGKTSGREGTGLRGQERPTQEAVPFLKEAGSEGHVEVAVHSGGGIASQGPSKSPARHVPHGDECPGPWQALGGGGTAALPVMAPSCRGPRHPWTAACKISPYVPAPAGCPGLSSGDWGLPLSKVPTGESGPRC